MVALCVVVFAFSACVDNNGAVGVRRMPSGDLQVLFVPCGTEDLSEALLVKVRGDFPDYEEDELVASAGPLTRISEDGPTMDVYSVRLRLSEDLSPDARYGVGVSGASLSFLPSELRTDLYRTGDGLRSAEGFLARSRCRSVAALELLVRMINYKVALIVDTLLIGAALIFFVGWSLRRSRHRSIPSRPDL
jgi:hypothetical protein